MPEPKALQMIRERIVDKPAQWKKARTSLDHGETALKRPPRGFDADHPMIEDIKRKSFTSSRKLTQSDVLAQDFQARFVARCNQIAPLMRFLADAVGVRW